MAIHPFPRSIDLPAATEIMKALAHPSRLAVVVRLRAGPATVTDLETDLGLGQPGLSQQLATLRKAGIVEMSRSGRSARYRLTDMRVVAVADLIVERFTTELPIL